MPLSYDYARCNGVSHELCQLCRRREAGRIEWQSYILPEINTTTGECSNFIEPLKKQTKVIPYNLGGLL